MDDVTTGQFSRLLMMRSIIEEVPNLSAAELALLYESTRTLVIALGAAATKKAQEHGENWYGL